MKINKTYQSLLDKSMSSMLSAIEIYNKPDFKYREEAFSILAVNSWELLFKARLLKLNNYKMNSIYQMEFKKKKNGEKSKLQQPNFNRAGNPKTISLGDTIKRLNHKKEQISPNLIKSLFSLIELRDNSIHFHNSKPIAKEIQELGFACVKNYMQIVQNWDTRLDLSKYNFYLMPLAYISSAISSEAILTEEVKNYLNFLKKKVNEADNQDVAFSVAIGIDINFKKSSTINGIGMRYDEKGVPVKITEEDITQRFPLLYKDVTSKARKRYSNFKQTKDFYAIIKEIKERNKLCHTRKFDPSNTKSIVKTFYSTNIWQVLDDHYTQK
jgi:predicted transport protein